MKRKLLTLIILVLALTACSPVPESGLPPAPSPTPTVEVTVTVLPMLTPTATISSKENEYEFPSVIDPEKRYLFYLHGKIIEDQGIPAISPEFGKYEYEAILEKLNGYDFVVVSEQRPKNTDGLTYAGKIKEKVAALLDAGVPDANITIVGASKGAGIAIEVSHLLGNNEVNYVIIAICHPDNLEDFKQDGIFLTGNVLSIYDVSDELAGSCAVFFSYSEGKGLSKYAEIVLEVGTGHGILYQPLDEWIIPTVKWARGEYP